MATAKATTTTTYAYSCLADQHLHEASMPPFPTVHHFPHNIELHCRDIATPPRPAGPLTVRRVRAQVASTSAGHGAVLAPRLV